MGERSCGSALSAALAVVCTDMQRSRRRDMVCLVRCCAAVVFIWCTCSWCLSYEDDVLMCAVLGWTLWTGRQHSREGRKGSVRQQVCGCSVPQAERRCQEQESGERRETGGGCIQGRQRLAFHSAHFVPLSTGAFCHTCIASNEVAECILCTHTAILPDQCRAAAVQMQERGWCNGLLVKCRLK